MSKKFMEIAIGVFFIVLSFAAFSYTQTMRADVTMRNETISSIKSSLSVWSEATFALVARALEEEGLLSPTDSNKIVMDVIAKVGEEDERLGLFARAMNDSYLQTRQQRGAQLQPTGISNSCQYAFDDECDEPNICSVGTDTFDCRAR